MYPQKSERRHLINATLREQGCIVSPMKSNSIKWLISNERYTWMLQTIDSRVEALDDG